MMLRSILPLLVATGALANTKRGLVFVPNEDHPGDNKIWPANESAISWYYNYQSLPSPDFSDFSQSEFAFVPMQWGVDAENPTDDTFLRNVEGLLDDGVNITHVLGFNEPDGPLDTGGSNVLPEVAAEAWVVNFEPLAERGVKLGLPACTGGWDGMPWLRQFLGNCSKILSEGEDDRKNCTWDFLPVHWYDNVEGLQLHIDERREEWPGVEIWVTEYAYAHKSLGEVQEHFNTTIEYFDDSDFIQGYTYFGAFRSGVSNVGPDVTFLNNDGELTDVGSWYMGRSATGVKPQSGRGEAVAVSSGVILGMMGLAMAMLV